MLDNAHDGLDSNHECHNDIAENLMVSRWLTQCIRKLDAVCKSDDEEYDADELQWRVDIADLDLAREVNCEREKWEEDQEQKRHENGVSLAPRDCRINDGRCGT